MNDPRCEEFIIYQVFSFLSTPLININCAYTIIYMPREWSTPKRECWNSPIHQILKAIDNHTRLYLETGNFWHEEQAYILRQYVKNLKIFIHEQEGR